MTAYGFIGNEDRDSRCHDGRVRPNRLRRWLHQRSALGGLLLSLLALLSACSSEDAVLLQIRPPSGITISEYAVTVQDHDKHDIVYQSGIQPIAAVSKGRDLFAEPLRLGLKLAQKASYLIHVRAAVDKLVPDGVIPTTRKPELFFAAIVNVAGTQQLDADLLEVDPMLDRDFDHFPDAVKWPEAVAAAKVTYQNKVSVLDCVDKDPGPTETKLPVGLYAVDINPLAKPRCGLPFDISCGDHVPPCQDQDGDGDPESTDCNDNDPARFHGNPRPRNCCTCTDKVSCATDHSKLANMAVCMPARCDSDTDYDCSGQRVPCFVDEDCDGYSPSDPVVSQRDCDDTNPSIYPGAKKNCADTSKDWACDGNPSGGCVDCDLDGDGYQRDDKAQGGTCPTVAYVTSGKKIDCDDNDRGVFPGSTMYNGSSQVMGFMDLVGAEGGGSKVAAMRQLCKNTQVDGTTAQDADCDGSARNGCPANPATCDVDADGFPNATAGCNPSNLPKDNLDSDPQSFPGAPDKCGDGKAQNGVADTPCTNDKDNDRYNADADCDDADPDTHPWAAELCDGKDNDCDGLIDELNPDDKGARMVETTTVAPIKKVILSCTDFYRGLCNEPAPTGLKTGRCVCSGIKPSAHDPNALRKACPATVDTTAVAPKCFGATQPGKQTCKDPSSVGTPKNDEDCDGRYDAPDGINLKEYGEVCGVNTGTCIAGTANGCDYSKVNPFSIDSGYAVQPPFVETRKYLTCTGATPPSKQLCDGNDENCNGTVDDCSDYTPTNSACCKNVAMCVNVATDPNHCGDCNTVCDPVTGKDCVAKKCVCGTDPACSGARGICKNSMSCVECLLDTDCKDALKPYCKGQDHCAACVANADCAAPNPACDGTLEACVPCTASFGCAGATSKCKVNANPTLSQCVQCLTNADCSGGTPACDTATNTCVPCITGFGCTAPNAQCKLNANSAMNACVQCLADGNCSGGTPACDLTANKCVKCTSANTTACTGTTQQCLTNVDPTLNSCVECTANAQCIVSPKLLCDVGGQYKCTACTKDMDCAGLTPFCFKDAVDASKNVCSACTQDMDCGAGKFCFIQTNPALNFCGDCKVDADCPAMNPACDPTKKKCVPCRQDSATLPQLGCANPTPACKTNVDPTLNMCVECTISSQCMGGKTCTANNCV